MSNNSIQQNVPTWRLWATTALPTMATTESRILELTKRLDKLRAGGDDIAVASGYTASTVKKIKEANASVVLLHKQCDEAVERLRENLAEAKALFEAKGMASRIDAINLNEEAAQGQAMADSILAYLVQKRPHAIALLRGFGEACPPQLAQALEQAEFSVPDSQPMSDVLRVAENVPRLQEENVALREQVEGLEQERNARASLLANANEALKKQKADSEKAMLSLKQSMVRQERKSAEVERQLGQSKETAKDLLEKITRLDSDIQKAEERSRKVEAQCLSQKTELGNLKKEITARENEKTLMKANRESINKESNKMKRLLEANQKSLSEAQKQLSDQANANARERNDLVNAKDQVDAKAGRLEAALGVAQFSLNQTKKECKSQEDQLKTLTQSHRKLVEQANNQKAQLADAKRCSLSQEEEMTELRDALRNAGEELQSAKEGREIAEQSCNEASDALRNASSRWANAEKRSMESNKTLASVSKDLEVERSKCENQAKEISLLREASKASAQQKRELEAQLEKSRSNLRRFLVGHENSDWARLLTNGLLQHDGQMLVKKSSWQPGWTVLAPWTTGYMEVAGRKDLDTLLLSLIILRQGAWSDKFAAYHTLCELETALLESSGDSICVWIGNAIFFIVYQALTVHRPTFMVRLMGWRILWLLHRRWAGVGDESLLEAHADDTIQALCQDYDADLIDITNANVLLVDQFVLLHPADGQGVVVIDHGQQSLRWVGLEMIRVSLSEVVLSPPGGTSDAPIMFQLLPTQVSWAYQHLI